MLYLLLVALLLTFVVKLIWQYTYCQLPPGPPRFPLIGSLLHVYLADRKSPAEALAKLSRRYGPIFTIQNGSVMNVVINSFEMLTQVGNSEDLLSRINESDLWFLSKNNFVPIGLLFSLPDFWQKTRSACQKLFRKHGFNARTKLEQTVMEQFMEFVDELKEKFENGELVLELTHQFDSIFFTIVTTLITGKKYASSDKRMETALNALDHYAKSMHFSGHISHLYPNLVPMFPNFTGLTKLRDACHNWNLTVDDFIDQEREYLLLNSEPNNFLAEFLQHVDAPGELSERDKEVYTYANLVSTFQDLQLGGTEGLSHLVKFFIKFLLPRPHVQQRLQDEVDEVVGKYTLVTTKNLPRLVYVQATVEEVLRLGCAVMMTPRRLLKDCVIAGYKLPKGMMLTLNIWGGSTDPAEWKNPKDFDPSRFLSQDGSTLINTEKVMAFGFGKRKCIGDHHAKTSLALVIATLVQQFSFHLDPVTGPPSDDDIFGFIRDTIPFSVLIRKR